MVYFAISAKLLAQMYANRLSNDVSPNSGMNREDRRKNTTYLMKLERWRSDFSRKLRFVEAIQITCGKMM